LGSREAGFQRVAPAHQLVHLRHNPLFFLFILEFLSIAASLGSG
jgi:hypothetical protein